MGQCELCDVVLNGGGYVAEFSSLHGATCFRLYHVGSGREILRTPKNEESLRENVFLYGNPVLFPSNRIREGRLKNRIAIEKHVFTQRFSFVSVQSHSRRKVFLSWERVLLPRQ